MDRRFGDQQIRDRGAVTHSMVMSEVALEHERPLEQVGWRRHDVEAGVQLVRFPGYGWPVATVNPRSAARAASWMSKVAIVALCCSAQ
jgi:hypothetical protein